MLGIPRIKITGKKIKEKKNKENFGKKNKQVL